MVADQEPQVSESQIAVHCREEDYVQPPQSFVARADANDPAIFEQAPHDDVVQSTPPNSEKSHRTARHRDNPRRPK